MPQHKSNDRSRRMSILYWLNPEYTYGVHGSPKPSLHILMIGRTRIPDIAAKRKTGVEETSQFPYGRQTRKHCLLAMFPDGRQTIS